MENRGNQFGWSMQYSLVALKYFVQPQYTEKKKHLHTFREGPILSLSHSKAVTGWRVLLLSGEEQLSLAMPPCLISGTSDLLMDHSREVQLYKHHLPGMQVCSRKGFNRYKLEPAAMGPWQLESNCLPSKQLKEVSRRNPQQKIPSIAIAISQKSVFT